MSKEKKTRQNILILLLCMILLMLFSSDIISAIDRLSKHNRLTKQEIVFLEKQALDNNITALHKLVTYYKNIDDDKVYLFAKKLMKIEHKISIESALKRGDIKTIAILSNLSVEETKVMLKKSDFNRTKVNMLLNN